MCIERVYVLKKNGMDFFKPGSTLKREDPKEHSYERTRARDAYKKQLDMFKIRFESELAKHEKLDFDAKQEVRIKAKRMREVCLSNYRESLQGLATTNHRRSYRDTFLGTREAAFQMHDTTILDYELRLASEIDTIISNLNLMNADKSNRETLDWMASLARQKFSYELFECPEHPKEVSIDLELEPEMRPEATFDYDEDMAGPIHLSRRRSPTMLRSEGTRFRDRTMNGHCEEENDFYPTFNREFNYVKTPRAVKENEEDEYVPRFGVNRIDHSPPRESLLNVPLCDYVRSSRAGTEERYEDRPNSERSIPPPDIGSSRRNPAPLRPPVDVDNEEDVEEFLAKSRALLRKSGRPSMNMSYLYDDTDEEDAD